MTYPYILRVAGHAVFHDDARRWHSTERQLQTIFRLLLQRFGATFGSMTNRTRRIVMLSAAILLPLIWIFPHLLFMGAGPEGARTTYTIDDFDGKSLFKIVRVFLIALVPIAVVVGVFWWFDRRSRIILRKWAAKNEFQITQLKQTYMFATGPFKWWTNSRNQIIYFVTVRDTGGLERSGWVRCGSYYNGLFGNDDKAEVKWEEPEKKQV